MGQPGFERQTAGGPAVHGRAGVLRPWGVPAHAAASVEARVAAASALARSALQEEADATDAPRTEAALLACLDDPAPRVRLALAEILAGSSRAPHVVVTGLAADRSDIAALVLGASPLLGEAELVDAVAMGDPVAQIAVASRLGLGEGVAGALAEVAALPACLVLCRNGAARIGIGALRRMVDRFGPDPDLREAIGGRPDLDIVLRHELVAAAAEALGRFVLGCGWMSPDRMARVLRDARDQASITLAAEAGERGKVTGAVRLVAHLRASGQLTPALLLRALLCGNLPLFDAAVSNLSGLPLARVAGMGRGARGLGFAALYGKAGLPPSLLPAFRAAAVRDPVADQEPGAGSVLQRRRIRRVLSACLAASDGLSRADLGKVAALLRRFEAEAARIEVRQSAGALGPERNPAGPGVLPCLTAEDRSLPLLSAA